MRLALSLVFLTAGLFISFASHAQVVAPSPETRPASDPQAATPPATAAAPPVIPARNAPPLDAAKAEKAKEHLAKEREKAQKDEEKAKRRGQK